MKYQAGDLLKFSSRYDIRNNGIALIINARTKPVPLYDLFWITSHRHDLIGYGADYQLWQIENDDWSKIG